MATSDFSANRKVAAHNFSKAFIEGLEPEAKEYVRYDAKVPGLLVRVSPKGRKAFGFTQRQPGGGMKKLKLGRWPQLTVGAARKEANHWRVEIDKGNPTPADDLRKLRERTSAADVGDPLKLTMAQALELYIKARQNPSRKTPMKDSTANGYRFSLGFFDGHWKNRVLVAITRAEVSAWFHKFSPDSVTQAQKTMKTLRAVINYMINLYEDQAFPLKTNPVRAIKELLSEKPDPKERKIEDYEFPRWWAAVQELPSLTDDRYAENFTRARQGILFALFTGCRVGEVLRLDWKDIDLEDESFVILDTKNQLQPRMPLSSYLLTMLRGRNDRIGRVFGYSKDFKHPVKTAVNTSGIVWTMHDLRRTFSHSSKEANIDWWVGKRLLNHKISDITSDYRGGHEAIDQPMRDASERVCQRILGLLS